MKVNWEKTENNEGILTIEVDAEKVDASLDRAFKKIVRTVNVPGFRKGRVPRQIFEARFGVESLYKDALDIIVPDAYTEAVKEADIEPIAQPEIDFEDFSKGSPFTFTAKVQVKPEVTLGEYKGIEVPEVDASVSTEEIDEELNTVRERQAELIVVEDGPAEDGDTVVIDFEGFTDGEPFEGGKGENHSLELGSGSFIPGFEEQVVGMNVGDSKDIELTFPEEYHSEELAGKDAVFKVTVHEIKRKSLPELDDEFAMDVSEYETLEEYKESIAKEIADRKEHEHMHRIEAIVVQQASENAQVDIPEAMIETELSQMLSEFENRLRMQGMNLEMYYQFSNQDESALKEQMREDAVQRVRNNLVLEAISKAENITASDEDVEQEFERLAEMYRQTPEEIRKIITDNDNLDGLKKDIAIRNTVKYLAEVSQPISAEAWAEKHPEESTEEAEEEASDTDQPENDAMTEEAQSSEELAKDTEETAEVAEHTSEEEDETKE